MNNRDKLYRVFIENSTRVIILNSDKEYVRAAWEAGRSPKLGLEKGALETRTEQTGQLRGVVSVF